MTELIQLKQKRTSMATLLQQHTTPNKFVRQPVVVRACSQAKWRYVTSIGGLKAAVQNSHGCGYIWFAGVLDISLDWWERYRSWILAQEGRVRVNRYPGTRRALGKLAFADLLAIQVNHGQRRPGFGVEFAIPLTYQAPFDKSPSELDPSTPYILKPFAEKGGWSEQKVVECVPRLELSLWTKISFQSLHVLFFFYLIL
jgi:hypothetical protein